MSLSQVLCRSLDTKLFACCLAMALVACGSMHQPAATASNPYVVQLTQMTDTELRADAGATMLKIAKVADGRPTISTELQYLGLSENGRIKLRVQSNDPDTNKSLRGRLGREGSASSTSDAVDFEQDQAEAFAIEGFEVETVEAQAAWIRYRIRVAGGG